MTTAIICLALLAATGLAGTGFMNARFLAFGTKLTVWTTISFITAFAFLLVGFQLVIEPPASPIPAGFWYVMSGLAGFSLGGLYNVMRR